VTVVEQRDWRHENSPPSPRSNPTVRLRRLPVPPEVIVVAVRWSPRFGLSHRDVEELLTERGVEVDHVSVYRWVLRFTPLLAEAARPCRHRVGHRWRVDETDAKVAGSWRYVCRAIDQFGQVIDVFVSARRAAGAAGRFVQQAIGATKVTPAEVTTDKAPVDPAVLEALLEAAWHRTDRCANNRVECDHGRLQARRRPPPWTTPPPPTSCGTPAPPSSCVAAPAWSPSPKSSAMPVWRPSGRTPSPPRRTTSKRWSYSQSIADQPYGTFPAYSGRPRFEIPVGEDLTRVLGRGVLPVQIAEPWAGQG
jgi:transposase-like protein